MRKFKVGDEVRLVNPPFEYWAFSGREKKGLVGKITKLGYHDTDYYVEVDNVVQIMHERDLEPVKSDDGIDDWFFHQDVLTDTEDGVYRVSVAIPNGMKLDSVVLKYV